MSFQLEFKMSRVVRRYLLHLLDNCLWCVEFILATSTEKNVGSVINCYLKKCG